MSPLSVMKEHQPGIISKVFGWVFITALGIGAILNIVHSNFQVNHPKAFLVVLVGLILFAIGKLSVILKKKKISFGTKLMTEDMANLYRLGYWIMIVGLLAIFVS
jgi:hypothetical protein